VIGGIPPEAAAGFEKLKWVVLYRGPYRGAKPLIDKLSAADLYHKLEIPEDRETGSTTVVVSVPRTLLELAMEIVDDEPAPNV
jgi:hypothetical protein